MESAKITMHWLEVLRIKTAFQAVQRIYYPLLAAVSVPGKQLCHYCARVSLADRSEITRKFYMVSNITCPSVLCTTNNFKFVPAFICCTNMLIETWTSLAWL